MFFSDELNLNSPREIEEIRSFLKSFGVDYEIPDKTYVIRDKGEIVATGSASSNILKYFFVNSLYSGQGAISTVYNSLLEYIVQRNYSSYFVFTQPENLHIFKSIGLEEVYSTSRVLLLEGGFYSFDKWINEVKKQIGGKGGSRGSIVVNCNPMTLGHKYLITKALEEVDELIIFVVEEDLSEFPFSLRFNIIKSELKEEKRVKVVKGGPYIISRGTFPTYFIKQKDEMLDIYTELDASIFADKIAKNLSIDKRFIGSEPKDPVTLEYNKTLKKILEPKGIQVKIIQRLEHEGNPISASYVRELLHSGRLEEAKKLLPKSSIEKVIGNNANLT